MIKSEELSEPRSCLNKARDDERIFVLLGRDPAAPHTIRAWAARRIFLGLNLQSDPKILEAIECARLMDQDRGAPETLPEPSPYKVAFTRGPMSL